MVSLCFHIRIHEPYRLRKYRMFDIGKDHHYFSGHDNSPLNTADALRANARTLYRPLGETLTRVLHRHPQFRFTLSVSGTVLEQLQHYDPITLRLYQDLVNSGRVEVLGGTHHHTFAFFHSRPEFERQVRIHRTAIERVFGITPQVFGSSAAPYTDEMGRWAQLSGYTGVIAHMFLHRHHDRTRVHRPEGSDIAILTPHEDLSADLDQRFFDTSWSEWPLTAKKFAQWIHAHDGDETLIVLAPKTQMFRVGAHGEREALNFLEELPEAIAEAPHVRYALPSDVIASVPVAQRLRVRAPEYVGPGWNDIQQSAFNEVYQLEPKVLASNDPDIIEDWRRLQAADHFDAMDTDRNETEYAQAQGGPFETYIAHKNALEDLKMRLTPAHERDMYAAPELALV